jgi:hypothetical protein
MTIAIVLDAIFRGCREFRSKKRLIKYVESMQASSTSPATLTYPAGYRGTRLRLFTCVCFDELQYQDRVSRGEPDTQVAHGSTVLSTRHFRWAEARLPLSAAGASSRAFVPALCCMIIQVSRCLGAWRSCGRPLVAVWRDMPGASEEERAVGDGVF